MASQFGLLGYTNMGKTTDLTIVQKTIIDTLHKESKPQTLIAKEAGCSQSAVSKHVNRNEWMEKVWKKRCTTNRENRSLMMIVKQNRFKNLGKLDKEWTEAGDKASRATTHRRVKEFVYSCHQRCLTWAKKKKNWTGSRWSKVLFSDESKFCISFGNQCPRVWRKSEEAHSASCLKSSVKFPHSVMIWGAVSSAGVGPLCFLMTMVLVCLTGQQTHQTIYGVLSRGKWETRDQKMQMSWRSLSKKPGLPYHLSSATNWSPPCHTELSQ